MKVVLIQSLLAPYRYPIYGELAKTPGWDFEVWFMGKKVKNRIWGEEAIERYNFKYKFLSGITLFFGLKDTYPFWINFKIVSHLAKDRPDVVIMMGWDSLTSFLANLYCRIFGAKFLIYSDSTPLEKSWRRFLTLPLVKLHVRTSDAVIAGGTRAKVYLESLGVEPAKIYVSYNTIDVEKYERLTKKYKRYASDTRSNLGVGNKKVIMYYAQMIERKGPDLLLLAYEKLKRKDEDIALLLIGDGPFRKKLEKVIKKRKIRDVYLLANPGDEEICRYYAIASVFVLPSREEVWGLVVNEAMAAGVPVVVSDRAGSSADLVQTDRQGFVFRAGSISNLAKKIGQLLSNDSLRREMALEVSRHIKLFRPRITVRKFLEAAESPFVNESAKIIFLKKRKRGLVSVVVPVRGKEDGLERTLGSLKKQKRAGFYFEVIVERDKRGRGSYWTRNKALEKARGEYIAFIDAGTTAPKDWLAKGVRDLRKYDYVGGTVEVVKGDGDTLGSAYLFSKEREFEVGEFFKNLHFVTTTNLFVRREVITKLGAFDPRLKSSGDLEFGNRVNTFPFFSQFYNPRLKVYHPARSYSEQIKKQKRLARGFVDLGRIHPKRFPQYRFDLIKSFVKSMFPPVWLFWKGSLRHLSVYEKSKLFSLSYIFGFIHHTEAMRHGLLRGR